MTRVPVTILRGATTPPWAAAQVMRPRVITVRPDVTLTSRLIAHELAHVLQWERHGALFPLLYFAAWVAAGFRYHHISYEAEARKAENDPVMLAWADALLRETR